MFEYIVLTMYMFVYLYVDKQLRICIVFIKADMIFT